MTDLSTATHRIMQFAQPLAVIEARDREAQAYEAAVAAHERRLARRIAGSRRPYLEKLATRMWNRMARFSLRLAAMEPRTQAGIAAKSAAAAAVSMTASDLDWGIALMASANRDAASDALRRADQEGDGELLALGRAWEASCARYKRACAADDFLDDALGLIAPPEALFDRPGETGKLGPYPQKHYLTGRGWYGELGTIETLRRMARGGVPDARRDEILRLHDRWRADVAAENERSGFTAAQTERQLSADENAALRSAICRLPARTPAGIDLKVKVVLWLHDGLAGLEETVRPEDAEEPPIGSTLALSLALDLARAGIGVAAPVARAADLASAA